MNPFTTKTRPEHSTLTPYATANETLALLDRLIEDAGVNPSVSVMAARADIGYTASQETEQLADVETLRSNGALKMTDALSILTSGKDNAAVTDEARYEATARLLTGGTPAEAKTLRTLENKIKFFRSREAAQRLRTLGDDIVTGLLQPWVERIMDELKPLARVVADGQWEAVYDAQDFARTHFEDADVSDEVKGHATAPTKVRKHYEILRAMVLTRELEHVAMVGHELRDHGFIPRAEDPDFPESVYAWRHADKAPLMRYSQHTPESASLWICAAIAAGAEPAALTAKQAENARPAPAQPEVKAAS